ncbi:MAG: hypothetical protein LC650_02125 [Actinobacteria bacterium]|nr:hypothetical protein [Actinomycetota bacterium]
MRPQKISAEHGHAVVGHTRRWGWTWTWTWRGCANAVTATHATHVKDEAAVRNAVASETRRIVTTANATIVIGGARM